MKSAVGSINRSRDRLQVSSGVLLPTNVTDDLALRTRRVVGGRSGGGPEICSSTLIASQYPIPPRSNNSKTLAISPCLDLARVSAERRGAGTARTTSRHHGLLLSMPLHVRSCLRFCPDPSSLLLCPSPFSDQTFPLFPLQ